jgi:hypothetical protein
MTYDCFTWNNAQGTSKVQVHEAVAVDFGVFYFLLGQIAQAL